MKGCLSSLTLIARRLLSNTFFKKIIVFAYALVLSCVSLSTPVLANPQGGQITAGNVTIQQAPNSTVINQSSQQAIINWQSFNIGKQESTHFQQPTGGVALNRISPTQGASQIYGSLTATGQIILINPAGIYFGPSAYVNVGGLIASTANISDQNFLNGYYQFTKVPGYSGSVINEGQIIAANHGLVALLGSGVQNNGSIQANLGRVVLASGDAFTMNFAGNDLISFTIDTPLSQVGVDQNGRPLRNAVSNTGTIIADGGRVLVTAKTAQAVLDRAINMQGVIEAKSVGIHNGEIVLMASGGKVSVSGKLIASGKKKSEKGGTVKVLGDHVALIDNASIDVAGDVGGGTVLIGGNAHGAGPEQNANYTFIGPKVTVNADALTSGDGGKVIVWSNLATGFYGKISARGGLLSGNGGWVETSGKDYLDVQGSEVNTLASNGITGSWLLDPTNIYIALNQANATAAGMTGSDTSANTGTAGNPNTFQASGAILDSLLTTSTLTTALSLANVIVTTTNTSGIGAGNITVVDPIAWVSANTLTLTAAANILINAAITTGTAASALILNAVGSVTQTAAIGGSGGLIQQGTGTVTLSQANTYFGATAVNGALTLSGANGSAVNSAFTVNQGGILTLDNSVTNNNNRLSGTNALTLTGGEFVVIGNAAANTAESMGALILPSGYSTITLTPNAARNTQLTFSSLNRTADAEILFRGVNLGANTVASLTANSSNIVFTTAPTLTGAGGNSGTATVSIISGAIGAGGVSGNTSLGTDFVTYNPPTGAVNGLRPLLASEYTATPANNVNVKLTANRSANDNFTINSLLLSGGITYNFSTSGARTLTVGSGTRSGNVLSINGANTIQTTTTGTLAFGTAEAKIFAVSNLTLGSATALTGTGGLTVNGPGVLLENRSVAISGGLTVNSGTYRSGIANALSTAQAVIVRSPGTLDWNGFNNSITTLSLDSGSTSGATVSTGAGTMTLGGNVSLNANGSGATGAAISGNMALGATRTFTIAEGSASDDLAISALISGSTFGLIKAGTGTLALTNIANTYTGQTTINVGTLSVAKLAAGGVNSSLGATAAATPILLGSASAATLSYTGGTDSTNRLITINGTGGGTIQATNSGTLTLSGTLTTASGRPITFNASGGNITASGNIVGAGNLTVDGNSSNVVTLTGANSYSGITTVNSDGILRIASIGGLGNTTSTSVASGATLDINLISATLTNSAPITINGSGVSGNGALTFSGSNTTLNNPITLNGNSLMGGAGSGTMVLGGAISGASNLSLTLNNAAVSLPVITLTSGGNLAVTTGGAISQTGALTIPGTSSFNAGANSINLSTNGSNNSFTGVVTLSNSGANNVTLNNNRALILGASTLGQDLVITAAGVISQAGALTVPGTASFSAGANSIDLSTNGAANSFTGAVSLNNSGANNVSLTNNRALVLGTSTIGQNLVTTAVGAISQTGILTVAGSSSFNAGANAITLTQNNALSGDVTLTNSGNNNVSVTNSNVLSIAASSVGSGALTLTGIGVSQSGAITQAASAGAVTINAGAGIINLGNAGNSFTGAVGLNNSGINNVSLVNSGALTLGTSNVGSGSLSLTSGGAMSETGAITQAAGAGAVILASTAALTNIDFSTAANNLSGAISFGGTLANIQDFSLRNINNSATLPTNLTSLSNLRNLTLQFDNAGISFPALTLHNGGNLAAIAGGAISETGLLTVPGTSSFNAGANAITLTQNNVFTGSVSLNNSGNNNVAVTNSGALSLGASVLGSGTLTLTGVGITQTGSITEAANAGAVTLNAGNGVINLANSNNDFTGPVSLNNSGANNVALTNAADLVLGSSSIGSGTLALTVNGALTQTGAFTQAANAGVITLTENADASSLILNQANDLNGAMTFGGNLSFIHNLTLRNVNAAATLPTNLSALSHLTDLTLVFDNASVSLPALTLTSGGNLSVDTSGALSGGTGGSISQTGVVTVPGTAHFNAGAHAITLTQNNAFTGDVTLTNSGNNDVAVINSLPLSLAASSVGSGALTLTGLGVSQSGALMQAASAGLVTINAGAGVIDLSNASNSLTGAVSLNNSGNNNVALTNSLALALGASNLGTGTLSVIAGGDMTETGAIVQAPNAGTVTLSVTAPASDILLASQANDFSGAVVYGGTLSNIRDIGRRNINSGAGLTLTNLSLLTNLRNATIIFDNASIFAPAFTLHNGGSLYADTSGVLSGGTGGSIIQLGAVTVPGTVTLIAGAHAIEATQNNVLGGDVILSNSGNNDVAITNTLALNLGASSVGSGTLSLTGLGVTQSGAITQAANAGTATINAGAGAINLSHAGNSFTGAVALNNSGNNNVALVNSGALTLGTSTIGSGSLSLTSGGAMSETGALTQAAGAGAVTLISTSALANIDFSTAANDLSGVLSFGGTLANIQDVKLRNINSSAALPTNLTSLSSLRNLTLEFDNAGISFPALTLHNSGHLVAIAGGAISETGVLTIPGTASFNAGANAITLAQANIFSGDVALNNNLGNGNVIVNNSVGLSLAASTLGSGTLSLTGLGVTQSGAITQAANAGTATINAGAGVINLSHAGNSFTGAVALNNSGNNNVALVNSGALTLDASTIGSGSLSLTSGGAMSETGALIQAAGAGVVTLASTAATTNMDFSTAANNLSGAITFGGTLANIQDVKLRNINSGAALPTNLTSLTNLRNLTMQFDNAGISFPALTLYNGGHLVAIAGGAISETGALTVPGAASFNAGANAIMLTQNNAITGDVSLTNSGNHSIAVTNTGLLSVGTSSVGSGALTLTGAGVSQSGAIQQAINAGAVTINAGANAINLANSGNDFTGAVSLNNSGVNNVQLTNSAALVMGASNVGSGALGLTAGGTLSQTGPIVQEANAGLITLSLTAPSSDILLASQPNNFNGSVVLSGVLSNIRDLARRNVNVAPGALLTPLSSLTNLRNVTVILDNASLLAPAVTLHNGGSLYVDTSGALSGGTGGSITQLGAITAPGTVTLIAGAHAINAAQNNSISGDVIVSNSGNNNVSVTNSLALNMGASSVGSGSLTLTGLGVSQSGAITQAAGAGTATINAGAGAINLTNTGNIFTGAVGLNNSGNNNVALVNNAALTLTTSSLGSGSVSLTSAGSINELGAMTQAVNAGGMTLASTAALSDVDFSTQANNLSGAITFGGTLGNIQDFKLRNTNSAAVVPTNISNLTALRNVSFKFDNAAIVLPGFSMSGDLIAQANGSITQTGAISGVSLTTNSIGGTNLTQNNAFSSLNATNSNTGNIAFTNLLPLTITGINESVGNATVNNAYDLSINGLINASGNVALTSGGAISEVGGGVITASGLVTHSVGGTVLNNSNIVSTFNAVNTSHGDIALINTAAPLTVTDITQNDTGNVTIRNTGALTTSGVISTNGGNVTLSTLTPDLFASVLTLNGNIQTNGGSITAESANPNNATALIVNGLLSTTPGTGGTLTLGGGTALLLAPVVGTGNITLQGNGLDITLFTLNFTNSVGFSANRYIIVNGALTSSSGANISLIGDNNHSGQGGVQIASAGSISSGGDLSIQGSSLGGLAGADVNAAIEIQQGASISAVGDISLLGQVGNSNIDIYGLIHATGTHSTIHIAPANAGVTLLSANVTADSGTVNFNSPVVLSNNVTVAGNNIHFANGITGNYDLALNGETGDNRFTLADALMPTNITITGNALNNNYLSVNAGSDQSWLISGTDSGRVTGTNIGGNLTFTQIQNLTGGDNSNTFQFSDGSRITGVINGGNLASSNTLDYSLYSNPIKVILANLFYSGNTENSVGNNITHFLNINNLIGMGESTLVMPTKLSTLNFDTPISGFVNDPLNFNQFTSFVTSNVNDPVVFNTSAVYNVATNQLTINGVPVQLTGFNYNNFSGNITIINNHSPVPPVPVPPAPISDVTGRIPAILTIQTQNYAPVNTNAISIQIAEALTPTVAPKTIESRLASAAINVNSVLNKAGRIASQIDKGVSFNAIFPEREFIFTLANTASSMVSGKNVVDLLSTVSPYKTIILLLLASVYIAVFSKRRTAYAFSFEMRTALNNIIGYSNYLSGEKLGAMTREQKEYLNEILTGSRVLAEELAKIEADKISDPDARTAFNLRTALMGVMGYADLYHQLEGNMTEEQKACLNEIRMGSKKILQLINI